MRRIIGTNEAALLLRRLLSGWSSSPVSQALPYFADDRRDTSAGEGT
jgi:hypothetical protein